MDAAAAAGLLLLVAVAATSAPVVRRRLSHRTWHGVHLLAYVAVALAFAHQLTTGHEFQHQPVARAAWIALHVLVLLALVGLRVALPVAVSRRHRLHVRRVVAEAPGVVSLEVGGVGLDGLGAAAGQFFHWRFLAPGLWREAHPFSLSEAPDGRRLRVTVKGSGDFTARSPPSGPGRGCWSRAPAVSSPPRRDGGRGSRSSPAASASPRCARSCRTSRARRARSR